MVASDQADSGDAQGWRVQLKDMSTIGALRAGSPGDAAARLSDRGLRAAAVNPDHSEAGRAAAEVALRARNLAAEPWRLTVPGFIKPADLANGERLFFGWGWAVRRWSGRAIAAVVVALIALALLAKRPQGWLDVANTPGDTSVHVVIPDALAAAIALAVLVPPLIWLFATGLRRKPARVLVLRNSSERALTAPLARMMAQELRPYGHLVSVSERNTRRDLFGWVQPSLLNLSNPLAAIWFVVGAPVRFLVRPFDRSAMGPATVLNARDYRNLARRLRDRIGLNLQVALTGKEALPVRTSDAWRPLTTQLLAASADAIVVDLPDSAEWLDAIPVENAIARCVFVSLWGRLEAAEALLQARGLSAPCFHYAPDGEMQRRAQFRAAMLTAMRAGAA
jgi:hypothetical protein